MHTSIAKTKTGWQSNSRIDLGNDRILRVTTAKDMDGTLTTTALVYRVVQEVDHRAEVHKARTDFGRRMMSRSIRATEAQVRNQHQLALDMVDELMPEIAKHYGG